MSVVYINSAIGEESIMPLEHSEVSHNGHCSCCCGSYLERGHRDD